MPYTQKMLLSLLSKYLSIPESKHFFPPHCYHAGPSHHHFLFRPQLHSPNWSLLQLVSSFSLHATTAEWLFISLQTRRDVLPGAGKVVLPTSPLWLPPLHLPHSTETTPGSSPPRGLCTFCSLSWNALSSDFLWFPLLSFMSFLNYQLFRDILRSS